VGTKPQDHGVVFDDEVFDDGIGELLANLAERNLRTLNVKAHRRRVKHIMAAARLEDLLKCGQAGDVKPCLARTPAAADSLTAEEVPGKYEVLDELLVNVLRNKHVNLRQASDLGNQLEEPNQPLV
jgi:hypothetical protein